MALTSEELLVERRIAAFKAQCPSTKSMECTTNKPEVPKPSMEGRDISFEDWREYTWVDPVTRNAASHHIPNPKTLYYERGHTCHRVVDTDGVSHCIPAPGYFGCILKWKSKQGVSPVNF